MNCHCNPSFDMRCKCYPSHIEFEKRHGKGTAGWGKNPGYEDNWGNCPERNMQAYDLLTCCSVISEKLDDPEAIVEELALIGITKPADIAWVQQHIAHTFTTGSIPLLNDHTFLHGCVHAYSASPA